MFFLFLLIYTLTISELKKNEKKVKIIFADIQNSSTFAVEKWQSGRMRRS